MANRVFLHVGTPKTGTTYLQTVMWANRDKLAEQGLLLPLRRVRDFSTATRERPVLEAPLDARGLALVDEKCFSGAVVETAATRHFSPKGKTKCPQSFLLPTFPNTCTASTRLTTLTTTEQSAPTNF